MERENVAVWTEQICAVLHQTPPTVAKVLSFSGRATLRVHLSVVPIVFKAAEVRTPGLARIRLLFWLSPYVAFAMFGLSRKSSTMNDLGTSNRMC